MVSQSYLWLFDIYLHHLSHESVLVVQQAVPNGPALVAADWPLKGRQVVHCIPEAAINNSPVPFRTSFDLTLPHQRGRNGEAAEGGRVEVLALVLGAMPCCV